MSEWISVKDRLPEKDGTYITLEVSKADITHFNAGKLIPAADDISGSCFEDGDFIYWVNGCEYRYEQVTHWMPLPEPPTNTDIEGTLHNAIAIMVNEKGADAVREMVNNTLEAINLKHLMSEQDTPPNGTKTGGE